MHGFTIEVTSFESGGPAGSNIPNTDGSVVLKGRRLFHKSSVLGCPIYSIACSRGNGNNGKQMLPLFSLALWLLNTQQKEMQDRYNVNSCHQDF